MVGWSRASKYTVADSFKSREWHLSSAEMLDIVVPLVVDQKGDWFLKTIFPSRKENRRMNR